MISRRYVVADERGAIARALPLHRFASRSRSPVARCEAAQADRDRLIEQGVRLIDTTAPCELGKHGAERRKPTLLVVVRRQSIMPSSSRAAEELIPNLVG